MTNLTQTIRVALVAGLACAFGAHAALVAYFPLDVDASDASGNGHDGIVVDGVNFLQAGATLNTGTSAAFPGTAHIDVPYSPLLNPGMQGANGSGSFTISAWVNAASTAGFNSVITSRQDGPGTHGPILYNDSSNRWSFWAGNAGLPGAWNALNHSSGATLGTWHHLAIAYDSATTTRTLYVDGLVAQQSSATGISANVLRDLHIGSGDDFGTSFYWDGLIDDVGIWNEELDLAEINQVRTLGVASFVVIPEPSTYAVFGILALGVFAFARKRQKPAA